MSSKLKPGLHIGPTYDENSKYKLYKIRFLMLAIFCFGSAMSNFSYCQYSIISDLCVLYYGVSELAISWTTVIMGVGFIIGALPGIWLFQKFGLRITLLIGMIGTASGFLIECGAIDKRRFWVVMLGQGLISLFQPAFLNASPFIAYKWFGANEVSKACSVAAMSNVIGSALSTVVAPSAVTSTDPHIFERQMYLLFFVESGVFVGGTLFAIFVFRERPATPPSFAQAQVEEKLANEEPPGIIIMLKDMGKIMKNPNYVLALISYGIVYGLWTTILTLMNQIILKIHPTASKDVGYLGLLFQFAGCAAMFIFGALLDKTRKYKEIAIFVYFGMTVTLCLFVILYESSMTTIYIVLTICGFFTTCFLSLGMELAVELTFPVPEITSSTCMVVFGNIGTLIILHIGQAILTEYGDTKVLLTFLVMTIIGLFTLGASNVQLKRQALSMIKPTSSTVSTIVI